MEELEKTIEDSIRICDKSCDGIISMINNFKRILNEGTEKEKMNVLASMGVLNEFMVKNWIMLTQKKVNDIFSV